MSQKDRAPAPATSLVDVPEQFSLNSDPQSSLLHKEAKTPRDGWDSHSISFRTYYLHRLGT